MENLHKGDKKLINAWAIYDWANSVYSLVIATAVFPIYYESVTSQNNGMVFFCGISFHNTTLLSYSLSFSFLVVAFLSPILSGIADYTGNKKRFLQFFCYLGSLSVMCLYFFEGQSTVWIGIVFTILASIGFWGSIVFYNSYLPEIAPPEDHDRVSAKGFMFGYTGSVILLSFNLTMVLHPEWYGITDPTLPSRISFLSVGIWWISFAQITFYYLPNNVFQKKPEKDFIFKGIRELKIILMNLKNYPALKQFLIAFFLYSIGVQTIILLAGIYGKKELGIDTSKLIITILLIQIVAIFGAFLFSRISENIGNIKTLKLTIAIWGLICFAAYLLDARNKYINIQFYALGAMIGMVLGAIQSLSRSTYSKLLPHTEDHTTYFSFFDVTEKLAIVLGTFIFGLVGAITESMRNSIFILAVFFLLGYIILSFMKPIDKH
ncbi:MFS transporter [Flavobacterium branchiophilum]|uniref:UMF1 family MFS transporter n=1 Tax=Flavobacterium branchiophilum TaxID=55197 RepID=A0A543FZI5_9FLAO|nr:MFS transporter [Flavobacterium branchiophilum]OXA76746.1 MFS transporter [Flavobacterium branchiophilum] [Flavobacterium branchiophilum NBRC 15030 = ATCC 35035]TQM39238.1 UMF1 family MFS transporter [Flavobacterium branchiophilum]GEM54126.1 MFS transporter [Flavobacterium branchiophilum NBRC 15030 = ATCC 35035]